MKNFLFGLFALLCLISCELGGDDLQQSANYILPIVAVEQPDNVIVGDTAVFKITYEKPNGCYYFNGFRKATSEGATQIAVEAVAFNSNYCVQQVIRHEVDMEFIPPTSGVYVFKFWRGTLNNGQPDYIEKYIEVVNN